MPSPARWRANVRAHALALLASAPLALALWATRDSEVAGHWLAFVTIVLAIPWVVPAFTIVTVLSVLPYMGLHRIGAPPLGVWLAGDLLLAALIGVHINVALLAMRLTAPRARCGEAGLREFLRGTRRSTIDPPSS